MCYTKVLLLFYLRYQVYCLTDITTLNCPTDFQVSVGNITSSQLGVSSTIYSSLSNYGRVQSIVLKGDSDDLGAYMNELMIPYIVFGVFFVLFFLVVICCCVFQKGCPPCQSWRRDFKRRPYSKLQLRCVMIFALMFASAILATSITAFTFITPLRNSLVYTKCSLYNGLDVAINGDLTQSWGGFADLSTKVDNISSLVKSAQLEANKYIQNASDLQLLTLITQIKQQNLDIYRNNKDAAVSTPNPSTTATALANNDPLPTVQSVFIKTGLGPQTTNNTMVNDINSSLHKLQQVTYCITQLSTQGYQVIQSANIMVDSTTTIESNTQNSKLIFNLYLSQLGQFKIDLDAFSSQYFNKLLNWGLYVMQGITGFVLAGSLLIIIGVVGTYWFNILQCRTMVHIGWVIYGITYVGVLALLYIFLSVGSIGHSFCTYYDAMLDSNGQFLKIQQTYSQNVFNKLDVCLFGDGDVLTKFNIAAEMNTVTNLFSDIQTFNDYLNEQSVNFINKTVVGETVKGWIDAMQKYRLGIYKDTNDALTTQDNANQAIQRLNLYSNTGGGVACSRDRWVFDTTNCTSSSQRTYSADSTQANGKSLSTNYVTCISLNENYTTSTTSSNVNSGWSQSDLVKRYQQIKQIGQNCSDAYDQIISRGNALINFRESRNGLFSGLKKELQGMQSTNQQLITILDDFKSRLNSFQNSVTLLNNRVNSKISGLVVSSDCRVLRDYMKFTQNVFCVNSISNGFNYGICCLVLTLLMIGGLVTGNVFAVRFGRLEYENKMIRPQPQLVVRNDQTFQKRKYTSSSSSSEQD